MIDEKDRFYALIQAVPGTQPLPSIGNWILVKVTAPSEVAQKMTRRLVPGIVSVPRHIEGVIRIAVSDAKTNERVLRALREALA